MSRRGMQLLRHALQGLRPSEGERDPGAYREGSPFPDVPSAQVFLCPSRFRVFRLRSRSFPGKTRAAGLSRVDFAGREDARDSFDRKVLSLYRWTETLPFLRSENEPPFHHKRTEDYKGAPRVIDGLAQLSFGPAPNEIFSGLLGSAPTLADDFLHLQLLIGEKEILDLHQ